MCAVEAHSPRDGCLEQAARIVDVVVTVYGGVRERCFWGSDMTCCGESGVGLKNVTRACEDLHGSADKDRYLTLVIVLYCMYMYVCMCTCEVVR